MTAPESEGPAGRLHVWQQDDGRWRWRWDGPDGAPQLPSTETYETRAEAAKGARSAFPDLELAPADVEPPRKKKHLLARAALVAAALLVARRASRRP